MGRQAFVDQVHIACIHAAWMNPVDNSPGAKAPVEFALGACRAAVQLERGRAGLRANTFCTSRNVALGHAGVGETAARGAGLAKPVHRPIQGEGRGVSCSPSLSPLFR